jgi:hypothetical protein
VNVPERPLKTAASHLSLSDWVASLSRVTLPAAKILFNQPPRLSGLTVFGLMHTTYELLTLRAPTSAARRMGARCGVSGVRGAARARGSGRRARAAVAAVAAVAEWMNILNAFAERRSVRGAAESWQQAGVVVEEKRKKKQVSWRHGAST